MRRQQMSSTVSPTTSGKVTTKGSTGGSLEVQHETRGMVPRDLDMRSRFLSTFDEMERLFDEALHRPFLGFNVTPLRNLFHGFGEMTESRFNVDIYEDGGNLVFRADLPGINRGDIDVSVVGNSLVISGKRQMEDRVDRQNYLRVERSYGTFSRSMLLPEGLDTEHITAHLQDGVLEIRIPRVEGGEGVKHITIE